MFINKFVNTKEYIAIRITITTNQTLQTSYSVILAKSHTLKQIHISKFHINVVKLIQNETDTSMISHKTEEQTKIRRCLTIYAVKQLPKIQQIKTNKTMYSYSLKNQQNKTN